MVTMLKSVFLQMPAIAQCVKKEAAETLQIHTPYEGCSLRMFRADGIVVSNRLIKTVHGLKKPWTIERYMGLLQRSASQVKLGAGYNNY